MYIQGRLEVGLSKDPFWASFYPNLKEAAMLLEEAPADSEIGALRTEAERLSDLVTTSIPTLNSASRKLIASTVLSAVHGNTCLEGSTHYPPHFVPVPPEFWALAAACHIGSVSLMTSGLELVRQMANSNAQFSPSCPVRSWPLKCLVFAARQGHLDATSKLIQETSPLDVEPKDYQLALRAAAYAGATDIVQVLINWNLPICKNHALTRVLCNSMCSGKDMKNYEAMFNLVYPYCKNLSRMAQSSIVMNAAEAGSLRVLRTMFDNNQLSSHHLRIAGEFSATYRAARNGHIECLIFLLDHGYLESQRPSFGNKARNLTASVALYAKPSQRIPRDATSLSLFASRSMAT